MPIIHNLLSLFYSLQAAKSLSWPLDLQNLLSFIKFARYNYDLISDYERKIKILLRAIFCVCNNRFAGLWRGISG